MGITDLKELVDNGEPVSPQEIAAAEAEHVENDQAGRYPRNNIEQSFAETREEIDAKYAKAIATAEERRGNAHAKNLKKRIDASEKLGETTSAARVPPSEQTKD